MHGALLHAAGLAFAKVGRDERAERLHAGMVRRGDVGKGEGKAHLVVLHLADLAEGQKLHLVHTGVGFGDADEFEHAGLVVVQAGDGDLPQRHGFAQLVEPRKELQGRGKATAHMGAVLFFSHVLEIEEHAVGHGKQGFDLGVQHTARSVEAGVQASLVAQAEQLGGKGGLHQRFTARKRDAAFLAKVFAEAQGLLEHVFRRPFFAACRVPGVGVVATATAQGATLGKGYEAHARAVQSAEALERMEAAF